MMTDRQIRAAITSVVRGQQAQIQLKDEGPRGGGRLTLLVRPTKMAPSAEFYATWYRDGERRSTKLGTYPPISLAEARRQFREDYQPDIMAGRDPHGPSAWRRSIAPTVEGLFEAYVADLEAKGKVSASRARYVLLAPSGVAEAVGRHRLAGDIKPDDIVPHLAGIRERGARVYAANVRAWVRAAFQFALKSRYRYDTPSSGIDWGVRVNPADAIPTVPEDRPTRDRWLTPDELRAFWWWLEGRRGQLRYRNAPAVMLVIATGQRPSEVLRLQSDSYDRTDGTLHWAKTKNGRPHTIPLPRQATQILDVLQDNEHGYYFPKFSRPDVPAPIDVARTLVDRYVEESGCKPFTMRDLRRTWKTLSGRAGLPKEIRDRLQNHAFKDVSSKHYDRYDYWDEKCSAMDRWSGALAYILDHQGPLSLRALSASRPTLQLTARVVEGDNADRPGPS